MEINKTKSLIDQVIVKSTVLMDVQDSEIVGHQEYVEHNYAESTMNINTFNEDKYNKKCKSERFDTMYIISKEFMDIKKGEWGYHIVSGEIFECSFDITKDRKYVDSDCYFPKDGHTVLKEYSSSTCLKVLKCSRRPQGKAETLGELPSKDGMPRISFQFMHDYIGLYNGTKQFRDVEINELIKREIGRDAILTKKKNYKSNTKNLNKGMTM